MKTIEKKIPSKAKFVIGQHSDRSTVSGTWKDHDGTSGSDQSGGGESVTVTLELDAESLIKARLGKHRTMFSSIVELLDHIDDDTLEDYAFRRLIESTRRNMTRWLELIDVYEQLRFRG